MDYFVFSDFSTELIDNTPGIYFLKSARNIIYVGQSRGLFARIGQHISEASIPFIYFSFSIAVKRN